MKQKKSTQQDNFETAEIEEGIFSPLETFQCFFGDKTLPEAKGYVETWLESLLTDDHWEGEPATLMIFSERMIELIEAADELMRDPGTIRYAQLKTGEQNIDITKTHLYSSNSFRLSPWDFFPRTLSKAEFLNPYAALNGFFEYQDKDEWVEIIKYLLLQGFCGVSIYESGQDVDVLVLKKMLDKFLEAVHLITVRGKK